jgi:tol-pal system protein YbgF
MKSTALLTVVLLLASASPGATLAAQSRQELQVLTDLRLLHEQLQQLRLALAALADQSRTASGRLDAQADLTRKNHADTSLTLESVRRATDTLSERLSQASAQTSQFAQELPAIRKAQADQQRLLDQILTQLTVASPTDPANASTGTPTAPASSSPTATARATYLQANSYYAAGDYELAVRALKDFLSQFPDAPDAADAQFKIGMSFYHQGQYQAAIEAFDVVIKTYAQAPDRIDRVSDAYFQQGKSYEHLGKKPEAIAVYRQVIKSHPDTAGGLQARQALDRLNVK